MRMLLLILCIGISISSCVSRLGRPELTGFIVDFNKTPIKNCKVGETITDKNGYFVLSEQRYKQFWITEFFKLEAPPVFISELVEKDGYETKVIYDFNLFGGSLPKGTKYHLDTIYLKSKTTTVDIQKLMIDKWEITTNQTKDMVYMKKWNFGELCQTMKCREFNHDFVKNAGTQHNLNDKLSPNSILRKDIRVHFMENGSLKLTQKIQYLNKKDSLTIKGKWFIKDNSNITITSDFDELNGVFCFDEVEYEYIKLKKK